MVHGQAIGIPFRRRKGEQAPPPPKEVAWNPTIESNLPYKEVKYFKFVEGAGWQALNIGEILPVGQRVMIRIVTTEPYYEVSKAVSSQMTGIQIGKNGVSEYDIAVTLTGYSPQILTVTIGVDKNYVQWNPVVESNAEYQVVDFYIDTYPAVVGNYYLISSKLRVAMTTKGAADEVTSLTVNGVSLGTPSINGNRFTFNGTLPDKSPQNINIAIDEYIRFEDIVQAYPLFFEFTDENGNLISWGGKAKVGSTITRTKGVAYANLLEGLYTVSNAKLNGNPLPSTAHVVEKQMVFTCTSTCKLSNEPNCILSNQILPIPNSSYKYLGHQPDLSGHGNHGVFNNFEFAGMSGANGYKYDWNTYTSYIAGVKPTDNAFKVNLTAEASTTALFGTSVFTVGSKSHYFRFKISGLINNQKIQIDYPKGSDDTVITSDRFGNGEYSTKDYTVGEVKRLNFYVINAVKGEPISVSIEQLPEYEGAICFNGVNNYMTIPTLEHGGKQVLMKVNWNKDALMLYDQRRGNNLNSFAIYIPNFNDNEDSIAYSSRNGGKTYIDGVLNTFVKGSQLKDVTHNITITNSNSNNDNTVSPTIGSNAKHNAFYAQMALFAFMSFPEISPEEEIKDLNDIVGIAGGYVEKPEYYWDCFGKTNDDPDRDAITEQVSKDVANALSVKNADFKLDSGFGKYEVDFLDSSIWNSSNSTITSSKIDCKNAISHIMLLYYNVGDKEYPDIPSFKVIKTGADIDYSYIDETGSPKSVKIVDGENVLPASHNTLYSGSGRFCGFGNPGMGNSVTITQIPEYQNGFVFNGKTAYLENLNILAITDFTAIAKRVWANKDNPMNECFIHKGVVSTPISESAFMLEYEITNDTYYRSASFGGYINVERVNRPENITYQTTESYNGIPIIKGSGIDTKGLVIGAVTNNYWKGIFYKLMLYSKTIDMLSINALKNLFALDILIDINHPIFKK